MAEQSATPPSADQIQRAIAILTATTLDDQRPTIELLRSFFDEPTSMADELLQATELLGGMTVAAGGLLVAFARAAELPKDTLLQYLALAVANPSASE